MAKVDDVLSNPTQEEVRAKDSEKGISTADVIAKAQDDRALFYMGVGGCETGKVRTINPGENITGPLNGASFCKVEQSPCRWFHTARSELFRYRLPYVPFGRNLSDPCRG